MDDLTIDSLHAAYLSGVSPEEIVSGVYDAVERRNDPGIFISLVERDDAVAAAGALPPLDPARRFSMG